MKQLSRLRARHWAWVLVLALVGIWWPAFIITSPPEFLQVSIDQGVLVFCMVVALIGTVIKIIGYLGSQMPGKVGVIGVSVELAGLILAAVGPASYLIISLVAFTNPLADIGINSAFIFSCALCAVYIYRAIIIVPRFLFEAHDERKDTLVATVEEEYGDDT